MGGINHESIWVMTLVYIILTLGDVPFKKSKAERLKRLSTPMDTSHAKARGSSTVSPKINTILATGIRPTGGSAGWGDMKRAVPSNIINHHHQLVTSGMLPTRLCDVMCISILSQFNIAMESHHQYIYIYVCVIGKNWTKFERAIYTIAKCWVAQQPLIINSGIPSYHIISHC